MLITNAPAGPTNRPGLAYNSATRRQSACLSGRMLPPGERLVQELEETIRVYVNQIQALAVRNAN